MNIRQLIKTAREIDQLAETQRERTEALARLAHDAKQPDADRDEIQRRKAALDATNVVDFGDAIQRLQTALHAPGDETPEAKLAMCDALIDDWCQTVAGAVPDDYSQRGLTYKYLNGDNNAAGMDDCAFDLAEILRPELARNWRNGQDNG